MVSSLVGVGLLNFSSILVVFIFMCLLEFSLICIELFVLDIMWLVKNLLVLLNNVYIWLLLLY